VWLGVWLLSRLAVGVWERAMPPVQASAILIFPVSKKPPESTAESLRVGAIVPASVTWLGLAVVTRLGLAGDTTVCSAVVPWSTTPAERPVREETAGPGAAAATDTESGRRGVRG